MIIHCTLIEMRLFFSQHGGRRTLQQNTGTTVFQRKRWDSDSNYDDYDDNVKDNFHDYDFNEIILMMILSIIS